MWIMRKKIILSVAFIISLLPMLMNQYGGLKGVQEITGMINLLNPIGIASVIVFFVGVWMTFKKPIINTVLCVLGTVGIVISEIYKFFTWHIMNITGKISFRNSIEFAFPEFYMGLAVSIVMVIAYFIIDRKISDASSVETAE